MFYIHHKDSEEEYKGGSYAAVWRRAMMKIKVRLAFRKLTDDVLVYGTSGGYLDMTGHYRANLAQVLDLKMHGLDIVQKSLTGKYHTNQK